MKHIICKLAIFHFRNIHILLSSLLLIITSYTPAHEYIQNTKGLQKMKTTEYKVSRILIQTISMITILANTALLVYVWFCKLEIIEINIPNKPALLFSDVGIYVSALNALFSVISASCITSKYKFWMKFCEKFVYIQMSFSCSSAVYFYFFYVNSLYAALTQQMNISKAGCVALLKNFNVYSVNNSLLDGFKQYIEFVIAIFAIIQIGTALGAYIQSWLFSYATEIQLEKKAPKAPKIETSIRGGSQGLTGMMRTVRINEAIRV
jgi:hypothetical protein